MLAQREARLVISECVIDKVDMTQAVVSNSCRKA